MLILKIFVIQNLEFGLNLELEFRTNDILRGLISHRNKEFKTYLDDYAEYFQCIHTNFIIKVYDKKLQAIKKGYEVSNDIIRIEVKFMKSREIQKCLKTIGLGNTPTSLSYITDKTVLNEIFKTLLRMWNEILFYDFSICLDNLDDKDILKLSNLQNYRNWKNSSANKRYKNKEFLNRITKLFSRNIKSSVGVFIKAKYIELING